MKEKTETTAAIDAVRAKLHSYDADNSTIETVIRDLGVESLEDLAFLEVADLTSAGLKTAKARKLLNELKVKPEPTPASSETVAETHVLQNQIDTLLPTVPTDESWLAALKVGGILKVDDSSYIAAIRAALADRVGLYNIPDALSRAMEEYADETEEQVDPTFFALRKSLTRRTYGDIFAAIDGLDGTFITENRRRDFLGRIRETLWPAIAESYRSLDSWYQTWRASFSDPSMLLAILSGGFSGGATGAASAGLIAPPDTGILHDAGDTLVDSINRVFRGTGVQVAAAMGYDANIIRNVLEDPRLPSMIGVKNRETMLKKIGTNVSGNYVRLEQNLVKYVLAFVKHDTVTSDIEVNYFVALWQLGMQINWTELGVSGSSAARSTDLTDLTGERIL